MPYTACALESYISENQLRIATYQDLELFSPSHFANHSRKNYEQSVMDSDRVFLAQLPFYQIKPLYVFMTRWFGNILGSYSTATVAVSALAFFFIGIAVWILRPTNLHQIYWTALIICFNLVNAPVSFTLLSSASTPDALAGALFLGGFAFIMKGRRVIFVALCWAGSVLSRPDYILTILSLIPFVWTIRTEFRQRLALVSIFCIPLFVYIMSKLLIPGYSLAILLAHTFLGPFEDPLAINNPVMDLSTYWIKLKLNLLWIWQSGCPAFFLIIGLAASYFLPAKLTRLALAAVLSILLKILIFPNIDGGYQERYYFASYILIMIACLSYSEPIVDKPLTTAR